MFVKNTAVGKICMDFWKIWRRKNADALKTNKIRYVVNGEVEGTTIEGSHIRRLILLKYPLKSRVHTWFTEYICLPFK
jgi:hypothetical protein